jgi:hypothetical protein
MSLTAEDRKTLAESFIIEYLEREPEFLDVVEFIEDNAEGDIELDDITDEDTAAVYRLAVETIDSLAIYYADRIAV